MNDLPSIYLARLRAPQFFPLLLGSIICIALVTHRFNLEPSIAYYSSILVGAFAPLAKEIGIAIGAAIVAIFGALIFIIDAAIAPFAAAIERKKRSKMVATHNERANNILTEICDVLKDAGLSDSYISSIVSLLVAHKIPEVYARLMEQCNNGVLSNRHYEFIRERVAKYQDVMLDIQRYGVKVDD